MLRTLLFTLLTLASSVSDVHAALKIVTTLPDLGAIARTIGGAEVEVKVLVHRDEDPHFVDPKPSFLVHLRQADVLILNGMGLEASWMDGLLSSARNAKIRPGGSGHIDASRVIKARETGLTDRSEGDIHPAGNPHYLYDPREALPVAALIGRTLARLDPKNGELFIERTKALRQRIFLLAKTERNRFSQLPPSHRKVVSYHRSLAYFADWLRLQLVAELEPKPGIAPTPAHVARVMTAMRKQGVRAFLKERYYPSKVSEKVAQATEARLITIRPSDGGSYVENLRTIVGQLYQALR